MLRFNLLRLFPLLSLFGFILGWGSGFRNTGSGDNENKGDPPPPDPPAQPEAPEEREHFYAIRLDGKVSIRATDPKLAFQKLQEMFPDGLITRDNATLVS